MSAAMFLVSTSDEIQIISGSAGNIDVQASYADYDSAVADANDRVTLGRKNTAITTATTTDVVLSPGNATTARNVKSLQIRNKHATNANLLTVQHTDGTTTVQLVQYNLLAGEQLQFSEGRWVVIDATGSIKYSNVGSLASQAEMEAAVSTVTAVTPGRQHFHPGHPKCWGKATVSGGVPTLQTSYNMTSITDTAAGQITWTIATDFSTANWNCQISVERAATALTVANLRVTAIRFGGQAAGTLLAECWDQTATTALAADPAAWHMIGLGDHV